MNDPTDSLSVDATIELSLKFLGSDLDSSIFYGQKALSQAQKIQNQFLIGASENSLGIAYLYQGNYKEAQVHFSGALKIRELTHDTSRIAGASNNLALAYQFSREFQPALEFHFQSMKFKQELKDTSGLRVSYNNIGVIYEQLEDYEKAKEYYERSLNLIPLTEDTSSYLTCLYNIGVACFKAGKIDEAVEIFDSGLPLAQASEDERMIGLYHLYFGQIAQKKGDYELAEKEISEALERLTALGKLDQMGKASVALGNNALFLGQAGRAGILCADALKIADETENLELQAECLACLQKSEAEKGNYKAAWTFQQEWLAVQDSLNAEALHKEVVRRDLEFNFQQRHLADSLDSAQQNALLAQKYENQIKSQRIIIIFGIILGAMILLVLILLFRNLKQKKQYNLVLEEKVNERTRSLAEQNEKLTAVAFQNAHLVRQPLAQLRGLIQIIQLSGSVEEKEAYLKLLSKSAANLDKAVREIHHTIEGQELEGENLAEFYFYEN